MPLWTSKTNGLSGGNQVDRHFLRRLFAGDLTASFVIALFIVALGMASPLQGALVGFLLWLGAAGGYGLGTQMASARSMRGYLIDAGRLLASMLLMGVVLGVLH